MIARHVRTAIIVAALAGCYIRPSMAMAGSSPAFSQEADVARCIRRAARGRAWLEKTLWGLRDQEGGWSGAEILNSDGSFDLGPMQVNSRWVARIAALTKRGPDRVRWWLIHDPCFNVDVARWIFLTGFGGAHGYWEAVGIYHSPTDSKQHRYAAGVAMHLRQRFGPATFSSRGAAR